MPAKADSAAQKTTPPISIAQPENGNEKRSALDISVSPFTQNQVKGITCQGLTLKGVSKLKMNRLAGYDDPGDQQGAQEGAHIDVSCLSIEIGCNQSDDSKNGNILEQNDTTQTH
jgi:hypothetical protein